MNEISKMAFWVEILKLQLLICARMGMLIFTDCIQE